MSSSIEIDGSIGQTTTGRRSTGRRTDWGLVAKATLWPLGAVLVISGFWEGITQAGLVDPIIVPPLSEVVVAFFDLIQQGFFWDAVAVTVWETVAGFVLGCTFGWVLGILIGVLPPFRYALYPLVVAFQNTPRVAFAPVFLAWFGFGLSSKIVMAAAICFFPLLISVVVGLENVDANAKTLMRSFGASRWKTFRMLSLPASLPYVFAGLKQAMTFAVIGAIVAEFVGADEGVGVLINTFSLQLEVARGFAAIGALMIIGTMLFGIVELADRKIVFWRSR